MRNSNFMTRIDSDWNEKDIIFVYQKTPNWHNIFGLPSSILNPEFYYIIILATGCYLYRNSHKYAVYNVKYDEKAHCKHHWCLRRWKSIIYFLRNGRRAVACNLRLSLSTCGIELQWGRGGYWHMALLCP